MVHKILTQIQKSEKMYSFKPVALYMVNDPVGPG